MIEGITHSICTLEFEDHRPFYDWLLDTLRTPCHPQQIEFSRLNLNYVVMSKRKLLELVQEKHVSGWDDPRMPTIQAACAGAASTPASLRDFAERGGVTKKEHSIELSMLENCVREDLDRIAPRAMAVLKPLRVVIENYPEGKTRGPRRAQPSGQARDGHAGKFRSPESSASSRRISWRMHRRIGFSAFSPAKRCGCARPISSNARGVVKDASGRVVEVRATYDPQTRGGNTPPDGRKVKGTLHWVSEAHAVKAEVRLYDRLFKVPFPGEGGVDPLTQLNPESLQILPGLPARRARARDRQGRRPFSVRAPGVFLRRPPRFEARQARVQSHRHAARFLGQRSRGKRAGRRLSRQDDFFAAGRAELGRRRDLAETGRAGQDRSVRIDRRHRPRNGLHRLGLQRDRQIRARSTSRPRPGSSSTRPRGRNSVRMNDNVPPVALDCRLISRPFLPEPHDLFRVERRPEQAFCESTHRFVVHVNHAALVSALVLGDLHPSRPPSCWHFSSYFKIERRAAFEVVVLIELKKALEAA